MNNKISNIFRIFLALFFICSNAYANNKHEETSIVNKFNLLGANANALKINASNWIIYDNISGQVIDGEKINERIPLANFTRIMLIYMLLNEVQSSKIKLTDNVIVTKDLQKKIDKYSNNRSIFSTQKEIKVNDIILSSLINNTKDSSIILSHIISKNEGDIINAMNQEAKRLGLTNTSFNNVTGEEHPSHYTTTFDIVKLIQIIITNYPNNQNLFTQSQFTYNNINYKQNNILSMDNAIDISISGAIKNKGSLIISKQRVENNLLKQKRRIIAIIINADNEDSEIQDGLRMLNYAFSEFDTIKLYEKGSNIGAYKIWMGKQNTIKLGVNNDAYITLPKGISTRLSTLLDKPKYIYAPIQAGSTIANINLVYQNKEVYSIPIVSLETVHVANIFSRMIDMIRIYFN